MAPRAVHVGGTSISAPFTRSSNEEAPFDRLPTQQDALRLATRPMKSYKVANSEPDSATGNRMKSPMIHPIWSHHNNINSRRSLNDGPPEPGGAQVAEGLNQAG